MSICQTERATTTLSTEREMNVKEGRPEIQYLPPNSLGYSTQRESKGNATKVHNFRTQTKPTVTSTP